MFLPVTLELLGGFWESLKVFILTLVFSIPLGLVVCFGSMSKFKPLQWLTRTFVWIIRGTPLMLQLIIIFYGPGLMFGLSAMPRFTATIVAFAINYACYFSEIYRGGIESIPVGQYEAGQVLGTVTITFKDKIIDTMDLVAADDVGRSEALYVLKEIGDAFSQPWVGSAMLLTVLLVVLYIAYMVVHNRRRQRKLARRRKNAVRR